MSWRGAWLRERLLLLSLALWDLVVVWGTYASIYRVRLGDAPGFTLALAVLVVLWLGGFVACWAADLLAAGLPGCLAAWFPACVAAWIAGLLAGRLAKKGPACI